MVRLVSIADIGSATNESSTGGSSNNNMNTRSTLRTTMPATSHRGAESGQGGGFNQHHMLNNNNNGMARPSITSSWDTDDSENRSIPTNFSTLSSLTTSGSGSTANTASRTTAGSRFSGRKSGGQVSIADLGGATNIGRESMMTLTTTVGRDCATTTTTTTYFQHNATDSSEAIMSVADTTAPRTHDSLRHHDSHHHPETSFSTTDTNVANEHSPHNILHQRDHDHPAGPMDIAHLGRLTTGNPPIMQQDMPLRVLTEGEGEEEEEEEEEMIIPLPYCYSRGKVHSLVLTSPTTTASSGAGGDGSSSVSDNEEVSVSSLMAIGETEEQSVHPSPWYGVGSRNLAAAAHGGATTMIQEPDQRRTSHSRAPPRKSAAGALAYEYHEEEHSPFPPSSHDGDPQVNSKKKEGAVVRLTDLGKTPAASYPAPVEAATCKSNATATPTPTSFELVENVKVLATLENHTTATEMKQSLELAPGTAANEVVAVLENSDAHPPPPPPHHATHHTIIHENDIKDYYDSDCGNEVSVQEATVLGELFESCPPLHQLQQEEEQSRSSLSSGLNSDTLVEKLDEELGIPMSVVFAPSHSMSHASNPIVQSIGGRLGRWRSGASRGSPRMGMKKMLSPNATSTTSIPTTTTLSSNVDSMMEQPELRRQSRDEEEPDSGNDAGPETTRTMTTASNCVGRIEQSPAPAVYPVEVSGTSSATIIDCAKSGEAIVDSPKPVRWVNAKSVFFAVVCTIVVIGLAVFFSTHDR